MSRLREALRRKPTWTEGTWVALPNGQDWCFPPPESVPGYLESKPRFVKEAADSSMSLANIDAINGHDPQIKAGNAVPYLATVDRAFGFYRVVYEGGSMLLRANYELADDEVDALLPFDYSVTDLSVPGSKVHCATPALMAICNQVAGVLGIDVEAELERIGREN